MNFIKLISNQLQHSTISQPNNSRFSIFISLLLFSIACVAGNFSFPPGIAVASIFIATNYIFILMMCYIADFLKHKHRYLAKFLFATFSIILYAYWITKINYEYFLDLDWCKYANKFNFIVMLVSIFSIVLLMICYYVTKNNSPKTLQISKKNQQIALLLLIVFFLLQFLPKITHNKHLHRSYEATPWYGINKNLIKQRYTLWCNVLDERKKVVKDFESQLEQSFNANKNNLSSNSQKKFPNVILVMLDALRADQNTKEIMPFLNSQPGIHAMNNWSSANCTHLALFGLFTSIHPVFYIDSLHFKEFELLKFFEKLNYKIIALPDQSFGNNKSNKYKISFFSQLQKYNINNSESLFYQDHNSPFQNGNKKYQVNYRKFFEQVINYKGNQPFFSTIYLSPNHTSSCFHIKNTKWQNNVYKYGYKDIEDYVNLLFKLRRIMNNKDQNINDILLTLKESYIKASKFADRFVVEEVINALKFHNIYDDSIIIIFGDHGEEMGESNHIGHGDNLSVQQMSSVLYIKLPNMVHKTEITKLTSNMDLFPTLIDYFNKNYGFYIKLPDFYRYAGNGMSLLQKIPDNRHIYSFMCENAVPKEYAKISNSRQIDTYKIN